METKANYVLIGAFTIIIAAALLLFGLWAAKYSSERSWQEYEVVFREAVTGLSVGSPVQYNGIAVGSITKLSLAPNDPRQVIARIRLEADAPVKTDTRAKAINSLTGPSIISSVRTPQAPALLRSTPRCTLIRPARPAKIRHRNRSVERLDSGAQKRLADRATRKTWKHQRFMADRARDNPDRQRARASPQLDRTSKTTAHNGSTRMCTSCRSWESGSTLARLSAQACRCDPRREPRRQQLRMKLGS